MITAVVIVIYVSADRGWSSLPSGARRRPENHRSTERNGSLPLLKSIVNHACNITKKYSMDNCAYLTKNKSFFCRQLYIIYNDVKSQCAHDMEVSGKTKTTN